MTPELRLPLIDRLTVLSLFSDKTTDTTRRFQSFFFDQPEIEEAALFVSSGFEGDGITAFYLGVGLTGFLLRVSQPRTGGIIPSNLNRETIATVAKSITERANTDKYFTSVELFDKDKELFLALTAFSCKTSMPLNHLLEGSNFLLEIYTHCLSSKRLEDQLGL